jgi:hypothetical protein
MARPTKYKRRYCNDIIAYFDVEPYQEVAVRVTDKKSGREYINDELRANDLPFFAGFARSIGVSRDTLVEWTTVWPEFSVAHKRCKELQEQMLAVNGLQGLYNASFAIFTAKNVAGWRDKQELEHTGKDGAPISFLDMSSHDDSSTS